MRKFILITVWLLLSAISPYAKRASHSNEVADTAPRYDLFVRVTPDAHHIDVTGTTRLPASKVPRAELRLSLSEQMRDFTVEVLEPAASAGIAVLERRGAGAGAIKWSIRPVRPIPAGEAVRLRFSYAGGGQTANQFLIQS